MLFLHEQVKKKEIKREREKREVLFRGRQAGKQAGRQVKEEEGGVYAGCNFW